MTGLHEYGVKGVDICIIAAPAPSAQAASGVHEHERPSPFLRRTAGFKEDCSDQHKSDPLPPAENSGHAPSRAFPSTESARSLWMTGEFLSA